MGSRTDALPKPMLSIQGMPILWYIVHALQRANVKRVVFPLGFRGDCIREYFGRRSEFAGMKLLFEDTGVDSNISQRMLAISHLLDDDEDFVLTNGDHIFNFDLERMCNDHQAAKAAATLGVANIRSPFGLVIEDEKGVVDFGRESVVSSLMIGDAGDCPRIGRVYSGITIFNARALSEVPFSPEQEFECTVFRHFIERGLLRAHELGGFWWAFDTEKDLDVAEGRCVTEEDVCRQIDLIRASFIDTKSMVRPENGSSR